MTRREPCTSRNGHPKKRWATARAAEFAARWYGERCGKEQYPYQCTVCGRWHVATRRSGDVAA